MKALWWAGTLRRPRPNGDGEPAAAGGARRMAAASKPSARGDAGDRAIPPAGSAVATADGSPAWAMGSGDTP